MYVTNVTPEKNHEDPGMGRSAQGSGWGRGTFTAREQSMYKSALFFYKSTIFTVSTCKSYATSGFKKQ